MRLQPIEVLENIKQSKLIDAAVKVDKTIERLRSPAGKNINLKKGNLLRISEGTALIVLQKNEVLCYCDRPGLYQVVEGEPELQSSRIKDLKRFAQNYSRFNDSKDSKQKTILLNLGHLRSRFECNVPVSVRIKDFDLQLRFYGFITFQISNPFLFISKMEQIHPKEFDILIEDCFRFYKGEILDLIIEWLQNECFLTLEEISSKQSELSEFCKKEIKSNPSREKGLRLIHLSFTELLPTADSRFFLEDQERSISTYEEKEDEGWDSMF